MIKPNTTNGFSIMDWRSWAQTTLHMSGPCKLKTQARSCSSLEMDGNSALRQPFSRLTSPRWKTILNPSACTERQGLGNWPYAAASAGVSINNT